MFLHLSVSVQGGGTTCSLVPDPFLEYSPFLSLALSKVLSQVMSVGYPLVLSLVLSRVLSQVLSGRHTP